ncbi:unnamed protein product, partial [Callosobruchus maculatus]
GEFLEIIGYLVAILKIAKRPLRVLFVLVPIYWNVFLALAAWDAFTVSNWHYMGPRILTSLVFEYDCSSLLIAGLLYDDFLAMHDLLRKTFRPVLSMDAALTKRFTRRRLICYMQFISITVLSILIHYVGVTPFVGDPEGDLFHRLFVRRFFEDNYALVVLQFIVFYTVISIMTFGSIVQVTMCMYSVIQINFQYHLLVDDLNNKLMFHRDDFSLIEDYSHQQKISKNLKRCVEELLKIQAVATKFFKLQSPVILVSMVSGGMVVLVLLYLLLGGNRPFSHFKIAGGLFVAEYMVVTFCRLGQEYSNAINRIWYSIFCVARKVK